MLSAAVAYVRACDPDDVFAFTTEKRVRIRHRWLGMLYYALLALIGVYVIGYQLVIKKQYIKREPLQAGAIQASLRAVAEPAVVDSLPYCAQAASPLSDALRCVTWPDILTAPSAEGHLLIGTRVSRTLQERTSCDEYDYGCNPWRRARGHITRDAYVGDIESATVLIQHDVSDRDARIASTGGSMGSTDTHHGQWARRAAQLTGDGGAVQTTVRKGGDSISVRDLLAAGGVRLDDTAADAEGGASLRYEGLTLVLTTEYVHTTGDYSYRVDANHVEARRSFFTWANATRRELFEVHGVQVVLRQASDGLPHFEFRTLLISLASGLALASTAKLLANLFLLYAAPQRHNYRLFVQGDTPDFSPDTLHEQQVLEAVLDKKRRKYEAVHSTRSTAASWAALRAVSPMAALGRAAKRTAACHAAYEQASTHEGGEGGGEAGELIPVVDGAPTPEPAPTADLLMLHTDDADASEAGRSARR